MEALATLQILVHESGSEKTSL